MSPLVGWCVRPGGVGPPSPEKESGALVELQAPDPAHCNARYNSWCNFFCVGWRLLSYRIATEVSRHRVAVWRELRRAGAVPLQSATWAIPTGQCFDDAVERAVELVERADGHAFVFDVTPTEATVAQLEELFSAEREAEWVEFLAECDKVEAEVAHEIAIRQLTLAELDEEEQNHERLRRWFRDLRAKDLFGAPSAEAAERRLKDCAEALEDYAERVYDARESPDPGPAGR